MKKIAVLCNICSSAPTARSELLNSLHEQGNEVYCGRVFDGAVNEYFTEGIATYMPIVATRNNTNPFVELRSLRSVKKAIKENDIDSVIVYGVKNHAAMAIGAKLGGAKKILCVVNGSGNLFRRKGFKGFVLRCISFPMLRIAYHYSFAVAFQNADDMMLFRKKHLIKDTEKCFVTNGSGVNLSVFFRSDLPSENRFLYLSRITSSKGMTEYIKAAEIVKKQYPDVFFDIVGPIDTCVEEFDDGLLEQAIDKQIVCYHGATDDVPGWMKKCRFFAYPSYYPEGVPRSAIQAIASGRPIITCNTSGCKETVQDGVNGFLIPPKDEKILAEKMIWMLEHPEAVERMAIASRKIAEEKFDVYKINQEMINKLKV